MGHLLYCEGIIGAGKSEYCKQIAKRLSLRLIKEPMEDNPYIDLFYQDPKRWAYEMQIYLLHRRIGLQQLAAAEALYSAEYRGAIIDRSLFGDANFEELHHEVGNISDLQHHAYLTAIRNMKLMIFPPTVLVFLDVEPKVALERIRERARGCEVNIKIEYLEQLTRKYHSMIQGAKTGHYPFSHAVSVLYVPWNHNTRTDPEWDSAAASLQRFLEETRAGLTPEWRL
jgi:deoxyadenosine/deoxycytidine kinase